MAIASVVIAGSPLFISLFVGPHGGALIWKFFDEHLGETGRIAFAVAVLIFLGEIFAEGAHTFLSRRKHGYGVTWDKRGKRSTAGASGIGTGTPWSGTDTGSGGTFGGGGASSSW